MGKDDLQYRKKLNQKQIELMHVLYRFRFATTELIAEYQGKKNGTRVYPRIMTLVEQGYIGRNFEPEYRKLDKPATYFLLPRGVSALKKASSKQYDAKVLHNVYGDKDASPSFIEENIAIFGAYCRLKARYGDTLQFFTKSDLAGFDHGHFPEPLPNAYLRLTEGEGIKQYFLDFHPSEPTRPFFKSVRRIKQYTAHADSNKWAATGESLPQILALCDTPALQKRLQKRMAKEKHTALHFLLTAKESLKKVVEDAHIWQLADRPDELVSLSESN